MPENEKPRGTFTLEDIPALRLLAIPLGLIIGATWLLLEDLRTRLMMTGLAVGMMLLSLFAIWLLRRFRNRK